MKIRTITKICLIGAIGFSICLFWGYFGEPNSLYVNHYKLEIKDWPEKLAGLKIIAISDIHGGSNGVTEEKIRQIVTLINQQDADFVVLLGDFVSQQMFDRSKLKMPEETIAKNLSGLKARYGVFAVLGNHEHWYGDVRVRDALESSGITVLEDELAVIDVNGEKLRILGLKDHLKVFGNDWKGYSERVKTIVSPTDGLGKLIVLEHSPDILPLISGDLSVSPDLKLFLAGHTHGGQIRLPIVGSPFVPSLYGQKYLAGHVRDNDVDLFVTTGIGESIFPFRFGVPPEIAVITIN